MVISGIIKTHKTSPSVFNRLLHIATGYFVTDFQRRENASLEMAFDALRRHLFARVLCYLCHSTGLNRDVRV